jgi:hypothetical protein
MHVSATFYVARRMRSHVLGAQVLSVSANLFVGIRAEIRTRQNQNWVSIA